MSSWRLTGQGDGNHHPLPHAARQLVRIVARAAAASGIRTHRAAARPSLEPRRHARAAVRDEHFGDVVANRENRVQCRRGLLEDEPDTCAADRAGVPRRPGGRISVF